MAAKTTSQSGLWDTSTTWGGSAPPVPGDTATITAGHTVTLNANPALLAGLTINGELTVSTTAGDYSIGMSGTAGQDINGSGILSAGSSGTPLPSNVRFAVNLNGSSIINLSGGLRLNLYATQPATRWCRLAAPASAGATALTLDTDLSADASWTDTSATNGLRVLIANINAGRDVSLRTVSSISGTTMNLTAGLTAGKLTGSAVALLSRNVTIYGSTLAGGAIQNGAATNPAILKCLIEAARCTALGVGHQIDGVCSATSTIAVYYGTGHTVSGVITAASGNDAVYRTTGVRVSGLLLGAGMQIADGLLSGRILGSAVGVQASHGLDISGAIEGCGTGISQGTVRLLPTAVLSSNTTDISAALGIVRGKGASLSSTTQVGTYAVTSASAVPPRAAVFIEDIGGVAGAFKGWCAGGTWVSDGTTLAPAPAPQTATFKGTAETANSPLWLEWTHMGTAGRKLTVTAWMKKSSNSWTETPRIQIIDPYAEAFSAGSILAETAMADNTDWQALSVSYTPSSDGQLIVRVQGKNASGNVWAILRPKPWGVSKARVMAGI